MNPVAMKSTRRWSPGIPLKKPKGPTQTRIEAAATIHTEDIAAALFRDEPDENADKPPRPKPPNKNTTAHSPELTEDGEGGEVAISGIHVDANGTIHVSAILDWFGEDFGAT